jgi:hypothetical protein
MPTPFACRIRERQGLGTKQQAEMFNHLVERMRGYLAGEGGKVTTQQLVDRFKLSMTADDTPIFRSMLRQIADFKRIDGSGYWILKDDFK